MTTLERRGARICPILKKLAEISLLKFDFKKSEHLIDIILNRGSALDKSTALFAYLLKHYFTALKSEESQAEEYLRRAREIKQDCKLCELEVIQKLNRTFDICTDFQRKPVVVYDQFTKRCVSLTSDRVEYLHVRLESEQKTLPGFIEAFLSACVSSVHDNHA